MIKRQEEFKAVIRERLGDERYKHSLNVADECRKLANFYDFDEDKAYITGLLHDVLKDTNHMKLLDYLTINGEKQEDYELIAPKLWHAAAGAIFAEKELGISDIEIINAIRYHTTGRRYMTKLDKILYVADFISEDRSYDGVDIMREKAYTELEYAVLEGVSFVIKDLIKNNQVIHPDTIGAYNQTLREVKIIEAALNASKDKMIYFEGESDL
ncbi:MAG TPA: bis(5'-nucleosyl)-tetraphosphatase (symmetrical) YqeK [Oscillospiraceae bacterium]|nr:bis(5'-nucleosyl)-tetraphosphatase (symmetrical) YqeK [Oscillospiraceae bacterium]